MHHLTQLTVRAAPLALAALLAVGASSCASTTSSHATHIEPVAASRLALVADEARPAYPMPVVVYRKNFNYKKANWKVTLDLGIESIRPHFKGALKACDDPPKALREELREDSLKVREAIRKKTPLTVPADSRYHPVGQISLEFQARVDPDTRVVTVHDAGLELLDKADELDADILILTRDPMRMSSRRGHVLARGDFVFTAYQLDCGPAQGAPEAGP